MPPTSILIACGIAWGTCALFLVVIMLRLNKATRYFYIPSASRPLGKVMQPSGPAVTIPSVPHKTKAFHRQKSHGRKYRD